MKKYLPAITILLFGVYILKLTFLSQLPLYINVHNIWYTVISGLVCICIGFLDIFLNSKEKHSYEEHKKKTRIVSLLLFIPLILALILGLFFPPRPLIYSSGNFSPVKPPPYANTPVKDAVIERLLGFNTDQYTFAEWYLVESLSSNYHYQNGKPVDLTGQIFTVDPKNHQFYFGRLYITCCVIDARPFAFPVHYLTLQGETVPYQPDEWLRIQGTFSINTQNGKKEAAVIPFHIQSVQEPENPYVN